MENYKLSCTKKILVNWELKNTNKIGKWPLKPPMTMSLDSCFCYCKIKWSSIPISIVNSKEYNWPIVEGFFDMPEDYHKAYPTIMNAYYKYYVCIYSCVVIYFVVLVKWCLE